MVPAMLAFIFALLARATNRRDRMKLCMIALALLSIQAQDEILYSHSPTPLVFNSSAPRNIQYFLGGMSGMGIMQEN